MSNLVMKKEQGHWLLAKMGKRVLRPGGKELTTKLVEHLGVNSDDDIVEFAPGLGFTASMVLRNRPRSYTGVELNEEAASRLKTTLEQPNVRIVVGNAAKTSIEDDSVDKVYGEAMLTMQSDDQKRAIVREAHRILKKDGLYGIHELGLRPDDLSDEQKQGIQRDLARSLRVNARPLTRAEWTSLLRVEGFDVVAVEVAPMHLLEPFRVVEDEGVRRAMKIFFNLMIYPKERRRIVSMRRSFQRHQEQINAVAIVARKV